MADDFKGLDLTKVYDDTISTRPFDLTDDSEHQTPKYISGEELSNMTRIDSSWKNPQFKIPSVLDANNVRGADLTKPEEAVATIVRSATDKVENLPDNTKNAIAQTVLEIMDKPQERRIEMIRNLREQYPELDTTDFIKQISPLIEKPYSQESLESLPYNTQIIDALDGREYPVAKWAQDTIASATKAVKDREIAAMLNKEQRGIDQSAWSNKFADIIGSMLPIIGVGAGAGSVASALGASGATAGAVATGATQAATFVDMSGQYAYDTAREYLDKTGDSEFRNFTAKDAKGLSALGYGAIGTMIEFGFGGVEPLVGQAFTKAGVEQGIMRAVGKVAAGEAWEEFLQEWEEFLFRKIDGTNNRTYGQALKDSLQAALWGGLTGGTLGGVVYRTNRRNIANILTQTGLDYKDALKVADTALSDLQNNIQENAETALSIKNKTGEPYNRLRVAVDDALKVVEDQGRRVVREEEREEFIDSIVDNWGTFALNQANMLNMTIDDFLSDIQPRFENGEIRMYQPGYMSPQYTYERLQDIEKRISDIEQGIANEAEQEKYNEYKRIANQLRKINAARVAREKTAARKAQQQAAKVIENTPKTAVAEVAITETPAVPQTETAPMPEYSDTEILGAFGKALGNGEIVLSNWENVRWSSLNSAGGTSQVGKRKTPDTESEKAKFARRMLDKYTPDWTKPESERAPRESKQPIQDAKKVEKGAYDITKFYNSLSDEEKAQYQMGETADPALQERFENALLPWIINDEQLFNQLVIQGDPRGERVVAGLRPIAQQFVEFNLTAPTEYRIDDSFRIALGNYITLYTNSNISEFYRSNDMIGQGGFDSNALLYAMRETNTPSGISDFLQAYIDGVVRNQQDTEYGKQARSEILAETIDKSFQSKKGTDQYNSLFTQLQRGAVEPLAPLEENTEPTAEQQQEAQEVARDVADGTITTGTPETPTENIIQDYGEKIEGAKKDIIGTKGVVAQTDIDKIMKKAPRSDTEKEILKNWLEQQSPEFVAQIRQLNLPIRVSKTTEYRNALAEAYTQHPELNLEEDRYDVLSGGAELSRETLDKYGIVPQYAFYYRTPDGYYVSITPENVAARLGGRGALQFSYSKSTRGEYFLWAKKGSGSWVPLISFETREEMDEHRNSHTQEDREKLYNEMTTYKDNRKKVIRERVGNDYRNGKNITEKEFAEAFGFRGVQFGNYENNEKRQREINNSYDSFMDLANILNLPPKAISLGGTLGIAFGARGSGTALAHYEPAQKVINITRDAGAGALAHEWFHALDNYLAQNLSEYANMAGGGFVTKGDNYYYYRVNAELSDALKEYLRAIKGEKGFQMRLRQLGQYWKRDWEVAARLFEQYVSSKVAEQNGINDYLTNPQEYYQKATPYLTAEESERVFPKIENMLGAIKTREAEGGNIELYDEAFDLADENARLDEIYPAYDGETIVVDGKERTVFNSNGDRIAKSEAALRNFYKWFGDSKVVDEQGRPLVVYHITPSTFDTFNLPKLTLGYNTYGSGIYTTTNPKHTSYGNKPDWNLMSLYMKAERPADADHILTLQEVQSHKDKIVEYGGQELYDRLESVASRYEKRNDKTNFFALDDELKLKLSYVLNSIEREYRSGNDNENTSPFLDIFPEYDSIVAHLTSDEGDFEYYVAFDPTQIKSVDNRGTYDLQDPNIYYDRSPSQWRGMFNMIRGAIAISGSVKPSTIQHELAHFWLDNMWNRYKSGKYTDAWLSNFQSIAKWLGVNLDADYISTPAHEQFARGYEAFISGRTIADVPGLKPAFDRYDRFVRRVYKTARDIRYRDATGHPTNPVFTKEAFDAFDRLLQVPDGVEVATNAELIPQTKEEKDENAKIIKKSIQETRTKIAEAQDQRAKENPLDVPILRTTGYAKDTDGKVKKSKNGYYIVSTQEGQEKKALDLIKSNPQLAESIIWGGANQTDIDRGVLARAYANFIKDTDPAKAELIREYEITTISRSAAKTLSHIPRNDLYRSAARQILAQKTRNLAQANYGLRAGMVEQLEKDLENRIALAWEAVKNAPMAQKQAVAVQQIREIASDFSTVDELPETLADADFTQVNERTFTEIAGAQIRRMLGLTLTQNESDQLDVLVEQIENSMEGDSWERQHYLTEETARLLRQYSEFIAGYSPQTAWDKATKLYYPASMLFNLPTHFKNVVTNFFQQVASSLSVAGGIAQIEIPLEQLTKDAKYDFNLYLKTGFMPSVMTDITSPQQILGEKRMVLANPNWFDRAAETSLNWLSVEDAVFKSVSFYRELAIIASKQAKKEGLTGKALKARALELYREGRALRGQTEWGIETRAQASEIAKVDTFVGTNGWTRLARSARNTLNQITIRGRSANIGNILSPFIVVGTNIVRGGFNLTGLPIASGVAIDIFHPQTRINDTKVSELIDLDILSERQAKALFKGGKINQRVARTLVAEGQITEEELKGLTYTERFGGATVRGLSETGFAWLFIIGLMSALDDDDWMPDYDEATAAEKKRAKAQGIQFGSIRIGNTWVDTDLFGYLKYPVHWAMNARRFGVKSLPQSALNTAAELPVVKDVMDLWNQNKYNKTTSDYLRTFGNTIIDKLNGFIPGVVNNAKRILQKSGKLPTLKLKKKGEALETKQTRKFDTEDVILYTLFGQAISTEE